MVIFHFLLKIVNYCQLLQHSQVSELFVNSDTVTTLFPPVVAWRLFSDTGDTIPTVGRDFQVPIMRHWLFSCQSPLEITDVQRLILERQSGLGALPCPFDSYYTITLLDPLQPFFHIFLDFFLGLYHYIRGTLQTAEKVSIFRPNSFFQYSGVELPHTALKPPAEPLGC